MKKNSTLKLITGVLLIVALMTGTAFAAVGQPAVDGGSAEKANPALNKLISGEVKSVKTEKDFTTITVTNEDGGMVFHADPSVFVIDQATKAYLKLEDIKANMKITAVVNKLAPTTFSLPPQTGGAVGFIINDDKGGVNLSVFDSELLNFEKDLVLNVSDKTSIVSITGEKKIFTKEDLKNSELLVMNTIMTLSLPAQTNPEFVMILNTAEQLNEKAVSVDPGSPAAPGSTADVKKESAAVEYVSLREGAESKGFAVKWTSNAAPIVLIKDDQKVELTIGSREFTFTHMTRDIKPLDNMKALDGPAKLEAGKTMVPKTFIDAL